MPLVLDPAVRDATASDPLRYGTEILDLGNALYDEAVAAAGSDDLRVRALGLETALFSAVPWDQLASSFTSTEVQDLLAERMSSPSALIRMLVGQYLWGYGALAHRRHGAAAAGAALQWGRELLAAPPGDHQRHDLRHTMATLMLAQRSIQRSSASALDMPPSASPSTPTATCSRVSRRPPPSASRPSWEVPAVDRGGRSIATKPTLTDFGRRAGPVAFTTPLFESDSRRDVPCQAGPWRVVLNTDFGSVLMGRATA